MKAWTDLITMKNLSVNHLENERLKKYEDKPGEKKQQQITGIMVKPVVMYSTYMNNAPENGHSHKKKTIEGDDVKSLLKSETPFGSGKVHPGDSLKIKNFESEDSDEDKEFLDMIDLVEVERTFLDNSLEKLEELSFDSFNFCQVLPGHGI